MNECANVETWNVTGFVPVRRSSSTNCGGNYMNSLLQHLRFHSTLLFIIRRIICILQPSRREPREASIPRAPPADCGDGTEMTDKGGFSRRRAARYSIMALVLSISRISRQQKPPLIRFETKGEEKKCNRAVTLERSAQVKTPSNPATYIIVFTLSIRKPPPLELCNTHTHIHPQTHLKDKLLCLISLLSH